MNNIEFSCNDIANITGAVPHGDYQGKISGLSRIEDARPGDITFYYDERYRDYLDKTEASCIIIPMDLDCTPKTGQCFFKAENPYLAFFALLKFVEKIMRSQKTGIDQSAIISPEAHIAPTAWIGPGVTIAKGCKIADGCQIDAGCHLYENVEIGEGTHLYASVVCRENTIVGKNCILQPGVVLGSEGFGYVENKDGSYERIPQLGNVILEDAVEIGANTAIDRALLGSTIIRSGVKIDNLVQIGHNVEVGDDTAIVSQVGIAGSCQIGKRNRLGGQVGLAGHLVTTDDVIIMAQSGVAKDVTKKGLYFGSPIKDRMTGFKIEASLKYLPDIVRQMKTMKKIIKEKFDIEI